MTSGDRSADRGPRDRGRRAFRRIDERADLNPNVALLMLDSLVTHVADPRYDEQLGVSRREEVRRAVSMWARALHRTWLRGAADPEPVR